MKQPKTNSFLNTSIVLADEILRPPPCGKSKFLNHFISLCS